jgi:hypothetical protein
LFVCKKMSPFIRMHLESSLQFLKNITNKMNHSHIKGHSSKKLFSNEICFKPLDHSIDGNTFIMYSNGITLYNHLCNCFHRNNYMLFFYEIVSIIFIVIRFLYNIFL